MTYVCTDVLGAGSFSTVYKCYDQQTKKEYAIKVCPRSLFDNEKEYVRFQREMVIMTYLEHENIISLHDSFADDANFYLVGNLCKGGELTNYIGKSTPMDEEVAKEIFGQIVNAVLYLHSHDIVHRDLKPQNIMFTEFPKVKLGDFGLSESTVNEKVTNHFCGSVCFTSPECLKGIKHDPKKSDIWSLGVILYSMVVGTHPWNTNNENLMRRNILRAKYTVPRFVSKECADLIRKMMTLNTENRITIDKIINHQWFNEMFHKNDYSTILMENVPLEERLKFNIEKFDSLLNEKLQKEDKKVIFENDALHMNLPNPNRRMTSDEAKPKKRKIGFSLKRKSSY
ncbi:CAMK family protein kinase [Tritrichomonas foetus]|uniref:CAMK family protein kinase n=1 Tax=Tritrichomonas foetus TaxID=1144522 RepID=A0A1J4K9M0_9EUKA|nr:CAMK family protein kinase [Tritrichomonas foetus]|eukprot:OHT07931.1 CAMK family protein kinase [Tritrichomonas foetus]